MKRSLVAALALFSVTSLAACSGPVVYKQYYAPGYRHNVIMTYHGNKDMKLVVSGNPYRINNIKLSDIIGEAMSGKNEGLPITFTAHPTMASDEAPGRVVVAFNPLPNAMGRNYCGELPEVSKDGLPNTAILVYCQRDDDYSTVQLKLPEGTVPGDPAFADAFGYATRQLLKRDPDPKGGRTSCDLTQC